MRAWFFAGRLAWRQMRHERMKTVAALMGVTFACILVFMQLGFKDSLFQSAASLPRFLKGDLFVIHKLTEAIWRGVPFSRHDLMRLYGHHDVHHANGLYISQAHWRNPLTYTKNPVLVLGFNPHVALIRGQTAQNLSLLMIRKGLLFDECSRPDLGPIKQLISVRSPLTVELNDHRYYILNTFRMGPSFAAGGNILMGEDTFLSLFPQRSRDKIDVGIVQLQPAANVKEVKQTLRPYLAPSLQLFTTEELVEYEKGYWRRNTAIGFIFGLGTVMSLIVGMVIVYQILFTTITNHLNEYATLKAMGYSQGYLQKIVLSSAMLLACIGFIPGTLLSALLYSYTESITFIPMLLTPSKIGMIFCFIMLMCGGAGLLALQKLRAANPADMF